MLTTTNWRHAGAGARRASRTRGQQLSRSAQLQQLAHSWHRLARPGLSNPAPSPRCVTARAAAGPGSESDEEPDASLTEELAHMKDPNRMRKAAEHLELAWQIQNAVRPSRASRDADVCECCQGSKEQECKFCHGTGILTIGDTMVVSIVTHSNSCPVCKGQGYVKCSQCRATGFRAKWLQPGQGGLKKL